MVPVIALAIGLTPAAAISAQPEGVGAPNAPTTTPGETPPEGAADARTPLIPALTNAKSPFRANRLASKPIALTPNQVTDPFEYPREPVELTWAGVAGAVDYELEIASNPGFSRIMYRATTDQAIARPRGAPSRRDVLVARGRHRQGRNARAAERRRAVRQDLAQPDRGPPDPG